MRHAPFKFALPIPVVAVVGGYLKVSDVSSCFRFQATNPEKGLLRVLHCQCVGGHGGSTNGNGEKI